jgi:hypothetical protein
VQDLLTDACLDVPARFRKEQFVTLNWIAEVSFISSLVLGLQDAINNGLLNYF